MNDVSQAPTETSEEKAVPEQRAGTKPVAQPVAEKSLTQSLSLIHI